MAVQRTPIDNAENLWKYDVTILSGASVSEGVSTSGSAMVGLLMPAAWTAAAVQLQASMDGITYYNVYNNAGGLEQSLVAASEWIAFPTADAIFAPFLRLLSATAASVTPVSQGADRSISMLFRRYLS